MADDRTKQEILFYTTILMAPEGITEDDIFSEMRKLTEELEWPKYLEAVPTPLQTRLQDAEQAGTIGLVSPLTWQIKTETVKPYVVHLIDQYLNKPEEQAAKEKLLGMLDSDSSILLAIRKQRAQAKPQLAI